METSPRGLSTHRRRKRWTLGFQKENGREVGDAIHPRPCPGGERRAKVLGHDNSWSAFGCLPRGGRTLGLVQRLDRSIEKRSQCVELIWIHRTRDPSCRRGGRQSD